MPKITARFQIARSTPNWIKSKQETDIGYILFHGDLPIVRLYETPFCFMCFIKGY